MSEASALLDHADEVILPIIALQSGFNGAVINITKDLNLYVRMGGNDENSGYINTDQHAFQTGSRAYDEAKRYVPSNGAKVIVNIGTGVYTPIIAEGPTAGPSPVIFRGSGAAQTTVAKGVIPSLGEAAVYSDNANIQLENFKVGGNSLGEGLYSTNGGSILVGTGMDFGAVSGYQIHAVSGGKVYNYEDYSISGGGTGHMGVWGGGSIIEGGGSVVTIPNNITFTNAFAVAISEGYLFNTDTDYQGREKVTGMRFRVSEWGYINTENSGLNYFPGTIDGIWETGGRYDVQGGNGPPGVAGPMGPKSMSLQLPITGDEVGMFFARAALTITQINVVVRGTTPGVTWSLRYAASRAAAGTPVITADTNTTTTANNTITTFNNPNIPANNWVWLKVNGTSGVVLEFDMSIQF